MYIVAVSAKSNDLSMPQTGPLFPNPVMPLFLVAGAQPLKSAQPAVLENDQHSAGQFELDLQSQGHSWQVTQYFKLRILESYRHPQDRQGFAQTSFPDTKMDALDISTGIAFL